MKGLKNNSYHIPCSSLVLSRYQGHHANEGDLILAATFTQWHLVENLKSFFF